MRGRYSTSFEAENDFVLNSHISAGLRKELKSKMRFKTASTHKETTYRVQIQSLLKDLKRYVNPFHGAARNMVNMVIVEVPISIVNGLLSSREKGEECLKEFINKRLGSSKQGSYEPIKRSSIQIMIEKKKKVREICILKEDWLTLGLFVAKYPDNKKKLLATL